MFQTVLYAIGRGLRAAGLAILNLLWEALTEIVRGAARGTGSLLQRAMPWVVGTLAVWGLMVFAQELFQQLLVLGIMIYGFKIMFKSFNPPAPKKKKG